jgi:hypothetical protein
MQSRKRGSLRHAERGRFTVISSEQNWERLPYIRKAAGRLHHRTKTADDLLQPSGNLPEGTELDRLE